MYGVVKKIDSLLFYGNCNVSYGSYIYSLICSSDASSSFLGLTCYWLHSIFFWVEWLENLAVAHCFMALSMLTAYLVASHTLHSVSVKQK